MANRDTVTQEWLTALKRGESGAWGQLCAHVRKMSRFVAYRAGLSDFAEDIEGEVLLVFQRSLVDRMQPGLPIAPFVYEVCRRTALSVRRNYIDDRVSSQEDEEGNLVYESVDDSFIERVENNIDVERSRSEVIKRFSKSVADKQVTQKKKEPRNQYGCGDLELADRLKSIRLRRGWTQEQMASYMGVKKSTYISYEHACVKNPSSDVYRFVKQMEAEAV